MLTHIDHLHWFSRSLWPSTSLVSFATGTDELDWQMVPYILVQPIVICPRQAYVLIVFLGITWAFFINNCFDRVRACLLLGVALMLKPSHEVPFQLWQNIHWIIAGDASPTYTYFFAKWRQLVGNRNEKEPRHIIAHLIRQVVPQARIIMSVREPVSRYVITCHQSVLLVNHKLKSIFT